MPFKHQMNCFRTFQGRRWYNFADLINEELWNEFRQAKAAGLRFKLRMHPLGFYQAFLHPDDDKRSRSFLDGVQASEDYQRQVTALLKEPGGAR